MFLEPLCVRSHALYVRLTLATVLIGRVRHRDLGPSRDAADGCAGMSALVVTASRRLEPTSSSARLRVRGTRPRCGATKVSPLTRTRRGSVVCVLGERERARLLALWGLA